MRAGKITGASTASLWKMLTGKLKEIVGGKDPLYRGAPGPTNAKPRQVNLHLSKTMPGAPDECDLVLLWT